MYSVNCTQTLRATKFNNTQQNVCALAVFLISLSSGTWNNFVILFVRYKIF